MTGLMKTINDKVFLFVLATAALFRFWGTFDLQMLIGDEAGFTTYSKRLLASGIGDWKYAPMTDLILAGTMTIFGDNPYGWRISGVVLGTAAIVLVYLIARKLYPERYVALLAASLLAFDPFHIHFCRTITQETPVIFFFLLFLYLILECSESDRKMLTFAGIAMGLTIATKAYFVFSITLISVYALYRTVQRFEKNDRSIVYVDFFAKLMLFPLSIYLLSHIFWFGRGHTLPELLQLKSDAYWVFNHNFKFDSAEVLSQGGKPWEWFVKVFSFGHQLSEDGPYGRFAIQINNPFFRIMVIPALVIASYHAVQSRRLQELLAPLLFVASYILFFLVNRQINSYSALVLLPFAYLALARAVIIMAHKYWHETEVAILFLCAIVFSGCYLFPISAGFQVPIDLYKPVLSISNITRAF